MAGGFRKLLASVAGNQSSSYIAYGATQRIYKDCAKQADYTITPEDRKAGKVKETEDGEEIGVGNGSIWHEGTYSSLEPIYGPRTNMTCSIIQPSR